MRALGLDEAGRGCVLGPLVVGGYCCEVGQDDALRAAGAADSKALSHKRRVAAREKLAALGQGKVIAISPAAIDQGNLTNLEEDAFLVLIGEFRPDVVYLDAPVHPAAIPAMARRMAERLRAAGVPVPKMVIEPKADGTYAVTGAASIFAKVARDAAIEALGPVGSGYPSDPVTRAWLAGFLSRGEPLPDCVRTRWGTIDALRQQSLFPR